MADQVKVEGLARFQATLAAAKRRIAQPEEALREAGRLVEQRGRGRAPVRSGRLAMSIRSVTEKAAVTVGSSLDYAAVTEYGGGNNIPAQPFLRPALAQSEPLIMQAFVNDAQKALDGVHGI